jgi:hypothetical protein
MEQWKEFMNASVMSKIFDSERKSSMLKGIAETVSQSIEALIVGTMLLSGPVCLIRSLD